MTPIIRPTLNLLYVLDTPAEMAGKPIELLNRAVRATLNVAAA